MFNLILVLLFSTLCSFSFAIILIEKRDLVAILKMSSGCLVAFTHGAGALGLSAVCDYGIFDHIHWLFNCI